MMSLDDACDQSVQSSSQPPCSLYSEPRVVFQSRGSDASSSQSRSFDRLRKRVVLNDKASSSFNSEPVAYTSAKHSLYTHGPVPMHGTIRYVIASVMTQVWFDWIIGSLIVLNVLMVVQDTNLRAAGEEIPTPVEVTLRVMPFLFFSELLLRIYAFRKVFFKSKANLAEMAVIVVDVVCGFLGAVGGDAPSFSLLRLLRVVRVARAFRAVTHFRELMLMIGAIAAAMRAILWSTFLIIFALMMFSILAVDVLHPLVLEIGEEGGFGDCTSCQYSFKSVEISMLTFMTQIIAGDSWGQVNVPTIHKHPWTSLIFFPMFVIINIGILNLVTAVIVETSLGAREEQQREDMLHRFVVIKQKLVKMFKDLDVDGSGDLSRSEILRGLEDGSEFALFLKSMQVTPQDIEVLFMILDEDGSGQVDLEEFVEGLHKMKTESDRTLLMLIRYYTYENRQLSRELMRGVGRMSSSFLSEESPLSSPEHSYATRRFHPFTTTKSDQDGRMIKKEASTNTMKCDRGNRNVKAEMSNHSGKSDQDNRSMKQDNHTIKKDASTDTTNSDKVNLEPHGQEPRNCSKSNYNMLISIDKANGEPDIPVTPPISSIPGLVFDANFTSLELFLDSVHTDMQKAQAAIDRTVHMVLQSISHKVEYELEEFIGKTYGRGVGSPSIVTSPLASPRSPDGEVGIRTPKHSVS